MDIGLPQKNMDETADKNAIAVDSLHMMNRKTKRIMKNTLLMYVRMFITMGISLYTSRIILHALGVTDLGIYNLVGGLVTIFSFINSAMLSATQRFINVELGREDMDALNKVFKSAYIIHCIIAFLVILLGITIGQYFIDFQLQIPKDRLRASSIVLFLSCITCAFQLLTLPFSADIIAHERINIYAWFSISESILKLAIAFIIDNSSYDRLIFYAVLMTIFQIIYFSINIVYCRINFKEVKGKIIVCKEKLKEMGLFAIWCLVGCTASSLSGQGINILLGMFFPPFVNASRSIAIQVQSAVMTFGNNLNTVMTPQLTQSYASGNRDYFDEILYKGSKYVFFLLLLIAIPILLKTEYITMLWLGETPPYILSFIQWLVLATLIESASVPLMRASDASGNIKLYHMVVGGILLLIVPASYLALKVTDNPITAFQVYFIFTFLAWFARLAILRETISLSVVRYVRFVMFPMAMVFTLSYFACLYAVSLIPNNFIGLVVTVLICTMISITITYFIGLNSSEREFLSVKIKQRITKI